MKTKFVLQILLLSALWGVSFLMIRIAGDSFPPLWVALLRSALGAVLLWTVLRLGGKQLPPRRLLPWLLTVALFNNALPFTLFAWGERTIPSNVAAVLNATTPIWTLVLTMAIHRTRAALLTIAGVFLGFGGVLVVVAGHAGDPAAEHAAGGVLRGTIVISLAALAYAIATVIAKAKLQGLDPIGLATTQLSLAGLMILLSQVSATHVAAVAYLLPLWGLFWGLFAHESIGLVTCIGVAITIAGLILLNWQQRPGTEPSTVRFAMRRL